jgi:hypothetical protein
MKKYLAPFLLGFVESIIITSVGFNFDDWQYWAIFIPFTLSSLLYRDFENLLNKKEK